MIENIRISEKAKQQLINIKRRTGIENWNVLCRWALMLSLAEKSIPPHEDIKTDSSVEMSWKVFSGEHSDLLRVLFKQRLFNDQLIISDENINYYFKLHLHRGVSYLVNKVKSIDSLVTEVM